MTVSISTRVKGGLPVIVTADVEFDRDDRSWYVDIRRVEWTSGKPVTAKVQDSITESDWERVEQELIDATYY